MKLSVVIPVYNVERYIEKCLDSVLRNDLAADRFEIIVVNDASPDKSLAIVNAVASKHANVKVISQENKGLGGARNTGMQNATGDYLLFLDSDDWMLPDTLSHLVSTACEHKLDVLEFSAQGIRPDGKITYHEQNDTHGKILNGVDYYNQVRYMNSACNKLYSAKFFKDNGLLFKERIFIEDFEFNTRAFFAAQKVMAIPFLAAQFLQSDDSITRNRSAEKKEKMFRDFIGIIQITSDQYAKHKSAATKAQHAFFRERLSFLVTTLFFQFFKYGLPYREIKAYKKELREKGLLAIDFPIHNKSKDLFRKVMLKNDWLFALSQPLLKRLR